MPSPAVRRGLRIAFGLALVVGGLLHGSGYGVVVPLVKDVANDARVIFPALWLGYGWHYVALGLVVLVAGADWRLLGIATLVALVDAGTHIYWFGKSPSEIMLFTIAAFGLAAMWAHREPA
jgi:hypothetical protein